MGRGALGPNKSSTRYSGGTDAWAENMSLMWTFRGIPTLYYGSEIEFRKGERIDCGPTCPLATTGRAYYGDHLAGSLRVSDGRLSVAAPGKGNLRVHVLDGPGRIGTDGPYLR